MNDFIDLLNFASDETFSLVNYLTNIALCAIVLYLLSLIYVKFGRSLSNRYQLSKVLILVGVTTFIIISIVKSSLALSLGLVGALSIIRFRTAIKEPEELGYFFISISIGLGFGANQAVPTLIGTLVLFLIIYLANRGKSHQAMNQNLIVNLTATKEKNTQQMQEKLGEIIANNANRTELIRMNKAEDSLDFNFLVVLKDYDRINTITQEISALDTTANITFIDSKNMTI
ncbi:DUF4956 domain-containing protein [Ulvibacterium marinum]|uniref:DUF4956 domain-containing protein n=1 Tax=Ulvibacterium marinum TaxID=2419782 RepID=UPI002494A783|nr:DUF4956 domain-containing protein [Ulvibacterium marinum]